MTGRKPVKIIGFVIIPTYLTFVKCLYPEVVCVVANYVVNTAIIDTAVISWLVQVNSEFIAIVSAKSRPGTKPHKTVFILGYTVDSILRKAILGS